MREQNSEKRTLSQKIKPAEIIIILLITIAAASAMLFHGESNGGTAIICKDGEIIKKLPLSAETVWHFPDGSMEFTVKGGKICVSRADCHDRVCMHTGYISGGYQSIVCLPNRVTVTIETEINDDIDVIL